MSFQVQQDTILLIDAFGHIYRSFYGIRHLTDNSGKDVNAIYGIARFLLNLSKSYPTGYGAVVYDSGKCRRRTALLPEYKAQRPPMPDSLRSQLDSIREWFSAFGWPLVEKPGLEADDLLAAIAVRHAPEQEVGIFSFDKDIMQLIDEKVKVLTLGPKNVLQINGDEEVMAKFGVRPGQLIDYLALLGDSADNIPGIPGVGPKTAARLLTAYGDIRGILEHLSEIKQEKLRNTLDSSRAELQKNYDLVRLDRELPDNWQGMEDIRRREPDWDRIEKLAEEHQFKSFLEAIRKEKKAGPQLELF